MDDNANCSIFHMGQTASIDQNKMKNSDSNFTEEDVIVATLSNQENQSNCISEIVSYPEYCDYDQSSDSIFYKHETFICRHSPIYIYQRILPERSYFPAHLLQSMF